MVVGQQLIIIAYLLHHHLFIIYLILYKKINNKVILSYDKDTQNLILTFYESSMNSSESSKHNLKNFKMA